MHIAVLNPYMPPPMGGIEKEMIALAREWTALGHRVSFVTTDSRFPSGSNRGAPLSVGERVEVYQLQGYLRSVLRGFQPSRAPLYVPRLKEVVTGLAPDLVLFYNIGWPITLRPLIGSLAGVPRLYRTYYHPPGGRLRRAKQRLILGLVRRMDAAIAASEAEKAQLVATGELEAARVAVIPPGVAVYPDDPEGLERFRARHALHGRRVVAHVGRLGRFKGTGHLIEALKDVRARLRQDVALLLVGGSDERPSLEELLDRHGVREHVRFTGELHGAELQLAYRSADVFALPSAYEALGIVFLEALSEGVPVVACPGGGVREVVGESGIVIPEYGDIKALADALVLLLGNDAMRRAMGTAGRRRVLAGYLWRHTAERMLELAGSLRA